MTINQAISDAELTDLKLRRRDDFDVVRLCEALQAERNDRPPNAEELRQRASAMYSRIDEADKKCAGLVRLLGFAVGYINAEFTLSGLKRGENSAVDSLMDWLERADAATK